jgi:hypothetical protein
MSKRRFERREALLNDVPQVRAQISFAHARGMSIALSFSPV